MDSPKSASSPECLPANEDLILSAAFIADEVARRDVLLLHALLETLREIPLKAKEPLMGEIRLKWWHEAIEEIIAGKKVRYHPINEALQDMATRRGLDLSPLLSMIEGQGVLLDKPLTLAAVLEAVEAGEGTIARLSAAIVAPDSDATNLIAPVRYYGLSLFAGSDGLPRETLAADTVNNLRAEAKQAIKKVPTPLMPLVAYIVMARDYLSGRAPGPLRRRFSVLGCFLMGRL